MLEKLGTEQRNAQTMSLDTMSVADVLRAMNKEDGSVIEVIYAQLPTIEKTVNAVIDSFQKGGRLIYVGAGTSGRLGILDAVECVPTFGVSPDMVVGLIAGGLKAFTKAVEGAEDNPELGVQDLKDIQLNETDTVIGIAASGRTPYVIGALDYASQTAAHTISISCNEGAEMSSHADIAIELPTGPEVLTGSTRLKAGSAQKMVLNMISTAAMIGIGKAYGNLMIDVQATNLKLQERSKRIIMEATGVDLHTAASFYEASGKHVKTATVMILLDCTKEQAQERIEATGGFVRKAIQKA
ncbi:N-acetylmuramic acid 6-phosphate etherase [Sporosarcina gallistercoris]|uniref:N-acetylmuramic acid 6-phosphate etherase n=1 Tax=Sporosarcina gallistercoris TaxID=2762245 RepID=A0ABR8PMQ9_9BACL|nr:N-acetylmuramic acid 6-phosphate etherase [Sporosarcina gallistercoris]MBD7909369.1 N-acetylmuramic acid 6-phosphate etherase [Sporosarcina gallistercoris]